MATQTQGHKDSKMQQQQNVKNGGKPMPPATTKVVENKKVFTDEAPSGTAAKVEAPAAEVAEAAKVTLSTEQKRALFEGVFAAEKAIKDAEEAVKTASAARSAKVRELIAGLGGKLGPWKVNGVLLRARVRGDSAYLLRPDDLDVETI